MTDRMPEDADRRREQALDRLAAARAALAAEGDRPACPGDLFAPPATARWPVEWLVVGPVPDDPGRLLAVPADQHPSAGSGDVAIPEDAPAGPLTVRCGFPIRLAVGDLAPRWRSGLLGPDATARVAHTCADLEAGRLAASDEQEEVESSPEYRHWIAEVIAPACAALAVAGEAGVLARDPEAPAGGPADKEPQTDAATPSAPSPSQETIRAGPPPVGELEVRRRPRSTVLRRALPLAASVLLAVSLALSGGVIVQSQRLERLEEEAAASERRLRAEVEALDEAARRDAEARRLEVERLTREKLAALAAAEEPPAPPPEPRPEPLANLPFAWLRPEGEPTRGEPPVIEVPPAAGMVALILPIDDPGSFERFRLEIVREATGEGVWQTDDLVLTGLAETSLALPGSLLPPGDYVFRLSGAGEAESAPLATYRLRVGGAHSG